MIDQATVAVEPAESVESAHDTGCFLAAMLQCMEAQVCTFEDGFATTDPAEAAVLARLLQCLVIRLFATIVFIGMHGCVAVFHLKPDVQFCPAGTFLSPLSAVAAAAAPMNSRNRGCAASGRDLNSGWN